MPKLPGEHSAKIVSEYDQEIPQSQIADNPMAPYGRAVRFIKLPFVIKIFVLSIFEWQFCTGFTVLQMSA